MSHQDPDTCHLRGDGTMLTRAPKRLFEVVESVSPVQTAIGVMYEARVRIVLYERGSDGLFKETFEGTWIGPRCTSDKHARREIPRGVGECYRGLRGAVTE